MIKVIPPGWFDYGEQAASLIKVASSGLRGNDLSDFIKRAGYALADEVSKMAFAPGEVPIHLLAMGAVDSTGANRNADGWVSSTLADDHHTFQKLAKFYRDHLNRDPHKSYGQVKHSYYNPDMKRVELIVALNGTKEAAARNESLVADKELNKLEREEDIPVSMSTKCAYDICSGCGNRAKTRAYYCTAAMCKYGGLKKNAGRVFEDGHHLYANTFGNRFFDISHVGKNADRSAFVFGKVASADDHLIGGAELAEILGVTAPSYLMDDDPFPGGRADTLGRLKVARELAGSYASLPDSIHTNPFSSEVCEPIHGLDQYNASNGEILKALALEKTALTLPEWLQLQLHLPYEKCAATARMVQPYLGQVMEQLIDSDELPDLLREAAFPAHEPALELIKRAGGMREFSLDADAIKRRSWLDSLRRDTSVPVPLIKSAGTPSEAVKQIAQRYLAYQIEVAYTLEKEANVCKLLALQACS